MRYRTVAILLGIVISLSCAASFAQVQQHALASNWGLASPRQSAWRPDLFADYLLTGQTPHPSVVRIIAPDDGGVSMGSGVLVDINQSQGLVLTNWHVIRDTHSAVLVQFPDGFQSAGTVIRYDEPWDLAALVIWKPKVDPVPISAQPPQIGAPLTIAGFGRGAYRAETGPCTDYLSPGSGYAKDLVELSATARQGDSGGPILNAEGQLAGVLFGESGGRTIGRCSKQLRVFLASVGAQGYTPLTQTQATGPLPSDGKSILSVQLHKPQQQVILPPVGNVQTSLAPGKSSSPPAMGTAVSVSTNHAPPLQVGAVLADFMTHSMNYLSNFERNGQTILAVAGGMALIILGLRMIFRSRVT